MNTSKHPVAAARRLASVLLLAGMSLIVHPEVRGPRAADRAAPAQRLFSSGFEGNVRPLPPVDCWDMGCWQEITGRDPVTRFSWPPQLHGGTTRFLLLTDPITIVPATIGQYMFNRVETVMGPHGQPTRALYQEISRNVNGRGPMGTSVAQNELQFLPRAAGRELYVSYWMKLQPDLVARMNGLPPGPGGIREGGTWRGIFSIKTGGMYPDGRPKDDGDYRLEAYVMTYGGGQPYWAVVADNMAGGKYPVTNDWEIVNRDLPVPVDKWFHFEMHWRRSAGADGRVWVGIDGQTIAEHRGPTVGARNLQVNRIIGPLLYTGSTMPVYQWVDDLEVWDGLPPLSH